MNNIEKLATCFIVLMTCIVIGRMLLGLIDGITLFCLIGGIMGISGLSLYQENLKADKWRSLP